MLTKDHILLINTNFIYLITYSLLNSWKQLQVIGTVSNHIVMFLQRNAFDLIELPKWSSNSPDVNLVDYLIWELGAFSAAGIFGEDHGH